MRILVVKLSSIGDIWHAVPAVARLQADLDASVDWVVSSQYVQLVRCIECVSNVIPFHRRRFVRTFPHFVRELRCAPYDLVVDLQGLFKSGLVAGLARGDVVGPRWCREGAHLFYGRRVGGEDRTRHAVERCLDVVEAVGARRTPIEYPVKFPEVPVDNPGPQVAIAPISRWETKNWPLANFIALSRRLLDEGVAGSLHLIGGAGDRPVCQQICDAVGAGARNWAGDLSLMESGGLLSTVDLLVANDSGPLHMAVAAGTPTVSFFGPTDPGRTGPYGDGHTVLRADLRCLGCYDRQCGNDHIGCMGGISVDRAFDAVKAQLAESGSLA